MAAGLIARSLTLIAIARVELAATRLLRRMAFGLVVILLALTGFGYLTAAAFLALAAAESPPIAALLVGLGCVVCALIGALLIPLLNRGGFR